MTQNETTDAGAGARGPSRRTVLMGGAGAAVGMWAATGSTTLALAGVATPQGLPGGLAAVRRTFRNWSGETVADRVWTVEPRSAADVVELANWAQKNGWTLRPRGFGHGWSPLLLDPADTDRLLLLDLRAGLDSYAFHAEADGSGTVTAGAGIAFEDLLERLEGDGYTVAASPAPGDLTLGGILAIGGHGTGLHAPGAGPAPGEHFGSISNLVTHLRAVVWDEAHGRFVEAEFGRDDPAIGPLLVNLGRVVVTEASLRVTPDRKLRCRSVVNVPITEVFAAPERAGKDSFARLLDEEGPVEVIWFPFTVSPWTKVWSVAPERPRGSRSVSRPFNYPFSDRLPGLLTAAVGRLTAGAGHLTPGVMNMQMTAVASGLAAGAMDIWGPSRTQLLYVRPTTLKVTANGYAILTKRENIQRVVSDFFGFVQSALLRWQAQGKYPMNGPLEVRVSELDRADALGISGAAEPSLSALAPDERHPDFDVAVWVDLLSLPGTPSAAAFYTEAERWLYERFDGGDAMVRAEWSKGWGYTGDGSWRSAEYVETTIRDGIGHERYHAAAAALAAHDPHGVFAAPMHRALGLA